MKRRDRIAIAVAAAVVLAAGLKDWSPASIVAVRAPVSAAERAGPPMPRLDLLDRVRWAGGAGERDLFRYVEKRAAAAPVHADTSSHVAVGGQATNNDGPPHSETVSLKFFGYAKRKTGAVRALFYEDESIYLAAEGDVIGGRYRVVRIGVTAAEVEDLARHTREILVMAEDALRS